MSNTDYFTIDIPCDSEGFVLQQCPKCGELFKLLSADCKSDDVAEIACPSCGIVSDSYFTDDVIELITIIALNKAQSNTYNEMKKLERQSRGKTVSITVACPPKPITEPILQPSIDAFTVVFCKHCGKKSKVSLLLAMSAFVCPLCGVNNFNDR